MIRKHSMEIVVSAAIFVLVVGFFTNRYINALRFTQEANEQLIFEQLKDQQEQLAQAQLSIDVLVSENKVVAQRIKEETEKRVAAETARKSDQQKIAALEEGLANRPDLTTIIGEWRPRIASIKCEWSISGGTGISSGSGTLFMSSGVPTLITNRHVVLANGTLPNECRIKFPDSDTTYTIEKDVISYDKKADFASIPVPELSSAIVARAAKSPDRCTSTAVAGDSIVILGYPSIGSKTDVTATEGIISVSDSPYYITSAKVERGNSGGAAILAKQNCYLGIPTFVGVGQIEALARILDQQTISF